MGNEQSGAKKKPNKDDLKSLGLDPSLFEDMDENEDFTGGDEDIDYDELMNGGKSKGKTKTSKKSENVPEFDIKSLGIENMDADVDEHIELTEDDLKDPSLLAELQDLGGEGMEWDIAELNEHEDIPQQKSSGKNKKVEKEEEIEDLDLDETALEEELSKKPKSPAPKQQTPAPKQATPSPVVSKVAQQPTSSPKVAPSQPVVSKVAQQPTPTPKVAQQPTPSPVVSKVAQQPTPSPKVVPSQPVSSPAPSKPASTPVKQPVEVVKPNNVPSKPPVDERTKKISDLKQLALKAKQSGDIEKAKEYLKKAKALEGGEAPQKQSVSPASAKPNKEAQITQISELQEQYKLAAVKAKQSGDLETAKNHMKTYKQLQVALEKVQSGGSIDVAKLPKPLKSKTSATSAPAKQARTTASTKSASAPAKASSAPKAKQSALSADDMDEPNPVENMIANDVLEWELNNINTQIAGLKTAKKAVPEDLVQRKQHVEMNLNLLGVKVQSGQLSQEVYINQLKSKIEEERALAKALLQKGKKDWAAMALQRAKIMESEIQASLETE